MYQKDKLQTIIMEMDRMKVNILGLSEVRWNNAGQMTVGQHVMIHSEGQQHERGVGFIIDQRHAQALKGYWAVSDGVVMIEVNAKPFDTNIIQVYVPHT